MSNRKVACFVVLGAVCVTLAAYSAFAQRSSRALSEEEMAAAFPERQVSNRAAKTNRLVIQAALTSAETAPVYALASALPDMDLGRPANPVLAAPVIPAEEPVAIAPPAPEPKSAAVPAPQDKSAEKPKKLLPPPPPAPQASHGLLDDGQINGLKGRLRLTEDQAGYWPAVESALRDVVRTHLRGSVKPGVKPSIDVNSPEVQKLIWAAMPLLMRLREDQKSEVRKLARVIGLEQVASQI